jgi:hypothetical protein
VTTPTTLTTLSGVMVPGIRSKCRILDTGDRRFALIGPGVEALKHGDRIEVVGAERPDLVNPCGAAFAVLQILHHRQSFTEVASTAHVR